MNLVNMLVNFFGISQLPTDFSDDLVEEHRNWKYLNFKICGTSINFRTKTESSGRIIGGGDAPLGAYPWMARLGYHIRSAWTDDGIEYLDCGGSVISQFYVITVAHCVPDNERTRKEVSVGDLGCRKYYMSLDFVRLGEHNADTDPDCIDASFCADSHKDYTVSHTIRHDYYSEKNIVNDIALIRVKKRIKFTKFIRPICLLRGKLLKKNFTQSNGIVAGWGVCDIKTKETSKILQEVELPILSHQSCRTIWGTNERQICAGGTAGKGACNGDSGGPLMKVERLERRDRHRGFHLLGIVSYGSYDCGARKTPGVFTRVSAYTLWILEKIRG